MPEGWRRQSLGAVTGSDDSGEEKEEAALNPAEILAKLWHS